MADDNPYLNAGGAQDTDNPYLKAAQPDPQANPYLSAGGAPTDSKGRGMGYPSLGMVPPTAPGTPKEAPLGGTVAFFAGLPKQVLDAGKGAPSPEPAPEADENSPFSRLGKYLGSQSPDYLSNKIGGAIDTAANTVSDYLTKGLGAIGVPNPEALTHDVLGYLLGGDLGMHGEGVGIAQSSAAGKLGREAPRAPRAPDRLPTGAGGFGDFFAQRGAGRLDFNDENPAFSQRLQRIVQDAERATGDKVRFTSLARSREKQAELYYNYTHGIGGQGLAAPPGHSLHERGLAADLADGPALDWIRAHASEYGLSHLGMNDKGHIQMANADSVPPMIRERGALAHSVGAEATGPREAPPPDAKWFAEQDDAMFRLRQQHTDDQAQFKQLIDSLPDEFKTPEMQEKFYKYMENPEGTELSPSEQAFYKTTFEPLKREERDLYEELKKSNLDVSDYDPTYAHRIVRGRGPVFDALAGERGATANPIAGYKSLTAPSLKARKFFALEDSNGGRRLVSLDGNRLTAINKRVGTPLNPDTPGLGESAAKGVGDTIKIDGKTYTLKNARTDEIEANTDTRYYKNAAANTIDNLLRLRSAARAAFYFNELKNSPEFATIAKKWDAKDIPSNWISPHMPLLSGFKMDPKLAYAVDDFYGTPKSALAQALSRVNQLAVRSLFWSPVAHLANTAAFWATARSWDWVTPQGIRSVFQDSAKAIVEVATLGKDYQEMLKEGSSFIYGGIKNQDFYAQMMKRLGDDVKRDPETWEKVARIMSLGASDLVKMIYDGSSKVLWAGSDMFMMQRIYELKRKGLSTRDAITEAEKYIPNYRIPPQVLGSRAVAQVLKDPILTEFSRYHYGAMKQVAHIANDLVGPPKRTVSKGTAIPPVKQGHYRLFHGHDDAEPWNNPNSMRYVASTEDYARNFRGGNKNVSYVDLSHRELPDHIREGVELNPGTKPTHFQLTPEQTARLRPFKETPGSESYNFEMKKRFDALGKVFVTGAMLYYAWPVISYGIQKLTGDKNLEFGPKGSTRIPSELIELYNGDKTFVQVMSDLVTMAPVLRTAGELYTNLDWFTGNRIDGPVDQVKGPLHQTGKYADFAATQMVQPYGMLEQAGRPQTSLAKEALKTGLGLRKKPKKYVPSKYDWRRDARRRKGLIEKGFDKL